jgi:hypothetical protein
MFVIPTTTTLTSTTYSWGILRVLTVREAPHLSPLCLIVIHPDNAETIANIAPGRCTSFRDHHGERWFVRRAPRGLIIDAITFSTDDPALNLSRSDLDIASIDRDRLKLDA